MTILAWDVDPGSTQDGFRIDVLDPDTRDDISYFDVESSANNFETSGLNLSPGMGYVLQVRAYAYAGSTKVFSPSSNKIYLKEAV
jgi:hypothetical protein